MINEYRINSYITNNFQIFNNQSKFVQILKLHAMQMIFYLDLQSFQCTQIKQKRKKNTVFNQ